MPIDFIITEESITFETDADTDDIQSRFRFNVTPLPEVSGYWQTPFTTWQPVAMSDFKSAAPSMST
jgi:hypothetical protein